jgi:beta-lactamase regulating signal transducer with metallopeptidase domain
MGIAANVNVERAIERLSIHRHVSVSTSSGILTPIVFGAREIVLPERTLQELDYDELQAVLAHEFAHIVRRDNLWMLLEELLVCVLWFQPLTRVAVERLRMLAEFSCDDWAVWRTGKSIHLADALVRVSEWVRVPTSRPVVAAMSAARPGLALARVNRMLASERRMPPSWSAARIMSIIAFVAPLLFAAPRIELLRAQTSANDIHTIAAHDDAGNFTVTISDHRVIAVSVAGKAVPQNDISQSGDDVRVEHPDGMLALKLKPAGGFSWESRPTRARTK